MASRTTLQKKAPVSLGGKRGFALKQLLDELVVQHKTTAYIPQDPISHPHRYIDDPKTCELVAFLTALLSYGRRDLIISNVGHLLQLMDNDPWGFMTNFQPKKDSQRFSSFVYRFNKGSDIVFLIERLQWAYREYESLENLFIERAAAAGAKTSDIPSGCGNEGLRTAIAAFMDTLTGISSENPRKTELPSYGLKFLFAHPAKGGPCKRMNMFLRWVVRQDGPDAPKVDLGLWQKAMSPRDLMIPLDTHVTQMNRYFGFTPRQTNTWETAHEITEVFRRFCPEDPIQYDYALMGLACPAPISKNLDAARLLYFFWRRPAKKLDISHRLDRLSPV